MKKQRLLLTIGSIAFSLAAATSAFAEAVREIHVSGNERVEQATVEAYLPFRIGSDFDVSRVGDVIKTLYATGLFHHVDVTWNNGVMGIEVKENPLVNRVVIEGAEAIVPERLKEFLILEARSVFTPAKAQRDARMIEEAYQGRGRFLTKVQPQIIARDQNRVDVIYKVEEGDKTKISNIRFIGNTRFDDPDLKQIVATKESRWWRILSQGDTYDPNRLEVDKELLRRYYLQHGYADFQVQSAVAEISRDQKEFFVTYTLSEGPRYDFGSVDVQINAEAENLELAKLQEQVSLKNGELYNAERVEKNVETLVDTLGNYGFAFLDVQPELERHEADRKIDVKFSINPGPRVYVNRINVIGNTRTRDEVIRRELRLAEGDAFSSTKLQRSRDRVNRLSFFKKVDIKQAETEELDRVDLTVEVEEQSTGEFNIGAGFSSQDGLLFTSDVKERNFLGKGQELAVKLALSERRQNYNLGFTEPYFLDRELAASVNVYNEQTDFQDESSYDLDNTGGGVSFRFPLTEFSSDTVRVGFREMKISDVGSAASSLVQREAGKRSSLFVGNTFAYDTRDSFLDPTRGHRIALTTEYSGFGSDVDYVRGLVASSWHKEIVDDVVLSVGGRVGAVYDLGQDLPIYEHFNAGGTTLRGFDVNGIGPRDFTTKDALGGKYLLGHNIELSIPLGKTFKELGVKGLVFTDGAIVSEFDNATNQVEDSKIYRISAGAGIHWHSPVGPLRLEFGVPLVKAEEDKTQVFSFNVGSRF